MALPGLEPTTKSPGSEVRRANHCAAGAPLMMPISSLKYYMLSGGPFFKLAGSNKQWGLIIDNLYY